MPRSNSGALEVTTPTHAFVITTYAMLTILGVQHLIDVAIHTALENQYGLVVTDLWSMFHILGGGLALVGALATRRERVPITGPRIEWVGVALIALTMGIYGRSLLVEYGWTGSATTQTLAWSMAIGAAARMVQIWREQRRLARALAHPATVEVAKEPRR